MAVASFLKKLIPSSHRRRYLFVLFYCQQQAVATERLNNNSPENTPVAEKKNALTYAKERLSAGLDDFNTPRTDRPPLQNNLLIGTIKKWAYTHIADKRFYAALSVLLCAYLVYNVSVFLFKILLFIWITCRVIQHFFAYQRGEISRHLGQDPLNNWLDNCLFAINLVWILKDTLFFFNCLRSFFL